MSPTQETLFPTLPPKFSEEEIQFMASYRENFGLSMANMKRITLFARDNMRQFDLEQKRKIVQFLNSDNKIADISHSQSDLIFMLMPQKLKTRHAYPVSFAKVAGKKGIYTSPSQAKELADEWNVIRRGTRYHGSNLKSDTNNEYLKKKKIEIHARESTVRLNAQANFWLTNWHITTTLVKPH